MYPRCVAVSPRMRWAVLGAALLIGVGVGVGAILAGSSPRTTSDQPPIGGPAAKWTAGERAAPGFTLTDESGKRVSLAAYRGVVDRALGALPASARPTVLAVSVNPPNDQPAKLTAARTRFRWRSQWRRAVGRSAELHAVWKSYGIEVLPTKGDVTHTEALYLVDSKGDERTLFLWPFRAADLAPALRSLS